MHRELAIAKHVQDWLLRINHTPMDNFTFNHKHISSLSVDGDFIDTLRWREKELRGFVIVDISGHGVSAVLLAPMFRSMIREVLKAPKGPGDAMKELYDIAPSLFGEGRYACLTYVLLNVTNRTATIVKGGQEPVVVLRSSEDSDAEFINPDGYPIGIDFSGLSEKEVSFEEVVVKLNPGDRIFLYTDGLVETAPEKDPGDCFRRERFYRLLNETRSLPPKTLLDFIFNDVMLHTGAESFEDDCTIAVIEAVC